MQVTTFKPQLTLLSGCFNLPGVFGQVAGRWRTTKELQLQTHPTLAHNLSVRTTHRAHSAKPLEEAATPPELARAPYRVLVIERDPMSGDLLAGALSRENWCHAGAVDAIDLLPSVASGSADLVVISGELDPRGPTGFNLTQSVIRAHPTIRVVMILARSTPNSVLSAFRSGARGVVSREQPISLFLQCIDHVRKGQIWARGQEADFLLDVIRNLPAPSLIGSDPASPLTVREMQIVQCAAAGKTNKVIAQELTLSEHTVKNYLFRIFEKLGVSSRIELLFYLTFRGNSLGRPSAVEPESVSESPASAQKQSSREDLPEFVLPDIKYGNIA
jgi:two-component system nitrate/nitrite response regulator NarL